MKVYVVTEGACSDYRIEAVFSTEELAESFVELYKRAERDCEIEPYEIDKVVESYINTVVAMSRDGNAFRVYREVSGKIGFQFFSISGILFWSVKTKDKERAITVTNEKRVQILAMNLWGNTEAVKDLGL